jgi:hypothetical protein
MSRRRLLQLTGMAPLAALATKAQGSAGPDKPVRDLSVVEIPQGGLTDLRGLAKGYKPDVDEQAFSDVAKALWYFFSEGVKDNAGTLPALDDTPNSAIRKLIKTTYKTTNSEIPPRRCGDLVVDKLADWEANWKVNTNICAWVCGAYAADHANGNTIEEDDFVYGYKETERRMRSLMVRARAIYGADQSHRGGGC